MPVYAQPKASDYRPFLIMAGIAVALTVWQHQAWPGERVSLPEYLVWRVTAPMEAALSAGFGRAHDLGLAVAATPRLAEENRLLRRERDELEAESIRTVDIHLQNKALREKLGFDPTISFMGGLAAQVIGQSSGGSNRWAQIRAAAGRPLEVRNVVVEAKGLVGRVVSAQGAVGRVVLLVDPTHAVRGKDLRTGDEGMVHAAPELEAGPNRLRLEKVRRGARLQVGDEIVTSDLGETYPGGIPIGTVESVRKPPGSVSNLTVYVYIKPKVDFDRLDYVRVLRAGEQLSQPGE